MSTIDGHETARILGFVIEDSSTDLDFKREVKLSHNGFKSQVDLAIYQGGNLIGIVENKTKGVPTNEQLSRIKNSCKYNDVQYVATTLYNDSSLVFENWKVLDFETIAQNIRTEQFRSADNFSQDLIRSYKEFMLRLTDVTSSLPITQRYDFGFDYNDLNPILDDVNLWDGFQKLRASHLLSTFQQHKEATDFYTGQSYHHKKATIDFRFRLPEDFGGFSFLIQLEGKQFRRCLEHGKTNVEKSALNLLNRKLFFSQSDGGGVKSKVFLGYTIGGVKRFVYQYEVLPEMDYSELFQKVVAERQLVVDNMNEIKNLLSAI